MKWMKDEEVLGVVDGLEYTSHEELDLTVVDGTVTTTQEFFEQLLHDAGWKPVPD